MLHYISTSNKSCVNRWAKNLIWVACSVWASDVFVSALGISKRKCKKARKHPVRTTKIPCHLRRAYFSRASWSPWTALLRSAALTLRIKVKMITVPRKEKAAGTLLEYSLPIYLFETNWKFSLIKAYAAYVFQNHIWIIRCTSALFQYCSTTFSCLDPCADHFRAGITADRNHFRAY